MTPSRGVHAYQIAAVARTVGGALAAVADLVIKVLEHPVSPWLPTTLKESSAAL
jgi:hypothetical protein